MAKISKRLKELRSSVEANKLYSIGEAVALVKAKPAAAKGQYLKKIAVSSTMGLGVRVDTSSVNS